MAVLVKTGNGLVFASIKTINGLAAASMKTWRGLDTTGAVSGLVLLTHSAAAGNMFSATSPGIDTTGANLLIGAAAIYALAFPTIVDNKGNTWNALAVHGSSTPGATMFWCKPTSVGVGHTITISSASTIYPVTLFAAFSGAAAAPYDQEVGAVSGGGTFIAPGALTPALANSLLLSVVSQGGVTTDTIDAGFTILDQVAYGGGNNMGGALAYLLQAGGPTAVNPTWSGLNQSRGVQLAIFKP
jgi:hypothetical protein